MKEITWLIYSILFICMGLCVIAGMIYCQNVCIREEIKKNRRNSTYTNVDQNWQKIYYAYSEEYQIAEWIRLRLDEEEIDLSSLIEGANTRTLALTIKLAEDDVNSAANMLKRVREKIYQTRSHFINLSSHDTYSELRRLQGEGAIDALQKQEAEALKNFENARANLEKLTTAIGEATAQPKPILTPEDIGG